MNCTLPSLDLDDFQRRLDRFRRIETRGAFLLSYMRSGAPYADSLDAYFGTIYGFSEAQLNKGAYESLKSQGLGLISDSNLRAEVVRVYEETMSQERSVALDLLRPYFLEHFRELRSNERATPLDYQAVASDPQFLNTVDYRLQSVTRRDIPRFEDVVTDVAALIATIEVEMNR